MTTQPMKAQTEKKVLNQLELMKQFIGKWKGEFGDGILFYSENKAFANGIISESRVEKDGKVLENVVQLYGYDSKTDKFIIAELKENNPNIELCEIWFTSATEGKIVITNPEDAPMNFEFEFKSDGKIEQVAFQDGKEVTRILLMQAN